MNLLGLKAPAFDLIDTVLGTIVKDDGITLWIKIAYTTWVGDPAHQQRIRETHVYKRDRWRTCRRMGWSTAVKANTK